MIPLWIIDLREGGSPAKQLAGLIEGLPKNECRFWHYTRLGSRPTRDLHEIRAFTDELINEGRTCYNAFLDAALPVGNVQIAVLGAAQETLTQAIFPSLGGLLRDKLAGIVPTHILNGTEITAMVYIPSRINQEVNPDLRMKTAVFLELLNTLVSKTGAHLYNRIVAYQDIQHEKQRFYARLDDSQIAAYEFQMLVHLFYNASGVSNFFACHEVEGSGIYCLGGASVFYSGALHQGHELSNLLEKLVGAIKGETLFDTDYSRSIVEETVRMSSLEPGELASRLTKGCGGLEIDLRKMDKEADPHPVRDMFRSELIPSYYLKYLKYMPARLATFTESISYILRSRYSTSIKKNQKETMESFRLFTDGIYQKVFRKDSPFPTIAQAIDCFAQSKDCLLALKESLKAGTESQIPIPDYLRQEYDICQREGDVSTSATLEEIKKHLRKEPIPLGLLVRSFLLGILLVFIVYPLIDFASPMVVSLGAKPVLPWIWVPLLIVIPVLYEFGIRLRRHFKHIQRLKYRLLAATIRSVNEELSQMLIKSQKEWYDSLINECNVQIERLLAFKESLQVKVTESGHQSFPETIFNQPLLSGSFMGSRLVSDKADTSATIRVQSNTQPLAELKTKDCIDLLKEAFGNDAVREAFFQGDDDAQASRGVLFLSELSCHFRPLINVQTAESAGGMASLLGDNLDIVPLVKMAGLNGMLTPNAHDEHLIISGKDASDLFVGRTVLSEGVASSYLMLTFWEKVPERLQAEQICNINPQEKLPNLSAGDKLALYYIYYRCNRNQNYKLFEKTLTIKASEIEDIQKTLEV